jgi:hypothetical protein
LDGLYPVRTYTKYREDSAELLVEGLESTDSSDIKLKAAKIKVEDLRTAAENALIPADFNLEA